MKAYSIFDDFPTSACAILEKAGVEITVHSKGADRPVGEELKKLIEQYDVLIIGTGQKIEAEFFDNISDKRIIATASVGMDHIMIPPEKKDLVCVINAPTSNRISVAEHTFALILALAKQIPDAIHVAQAGLHKKAMRYTPVDLYGKTIGVIGAGGTGKAVLDMAASFGMKRLCWTAHPDRHLDIESVEFLSLDDVLSHADIISVNLPVASETVGIIGKSQIQEMKDDAILISTSRTEIIDTVALFQRVKECPSFCVGLDVDADKVMGLWDETMDNVIVTPHIAGGTVQSRMRLFEEVARNTIKAI